MRTLVKALRLLFVVMSVSVLITACYGLDPTLTPPGLYTGRLYVISPSIVGNLTELSRLSTDLDSGSVVGIHYQTAENILLAVYTGNGFLRGWDLTTGEVFFEHDLNIVSAEGLGFDRSGSLVMGATRHEIWDNGNGLREYIGGITIWNVQTDALMACIVGPCEGYPAITDSAQIPSHLGAILGPEGRWTLEYDERVLSINDLSTSENAGVVQLVSNPDYEWKNVGRITFDPTGARHAIAFQEGQIEIEETSELGRSWFSPVIHLGENKDGDLQEIPALSFAPNNQWLARIRDDKLSIWRIGVVRGSLYLEENVPGARLLVFDQLSALLIVGTDEKISIWDVKGKTILAEYMTPNITSLAVSSDNRLLIWGDALGVVHIWGIPNP